jgi:hypothetical protein
MPINADKVTITIEHLSNGYWKATYETSSKLHVITHSKSCDLFSNYDGAMHWVKGEVDYFLSQENYLNRRGG